MTREIDVTHFDRALWEAKRGLTYVQDMMAVLIAAGDITPAERVILGNFRVTLDRAVIATRRVADELAVVTATTRQIVNKGAEA